MKWHDIVRACRPFLETNDLESAITKGTAVGLDLPREYWERALLTMSLPTSPADVPLQGRSAFAQMCALAQQFERYHGQVRKQERHERRPFIRLVKGIRVE